jgi:hypothetical protein
MLLLTEFVSKHAFGDGGTNFKANRIHRTSVVVTATGYGLHDRGIGIRVTVGSRILSPPVFQTESGVHPTSYPMGTGSPLP